MARNKVKKIGSLGLGRMGGLIVKHLVDAGFEVTGYDPVPKTRRDCQEKRRENREKRRRCR